jgi:C4-dicarboxylate-specific signal transduction histidine kinase
MLGELAASIAHEVNQPLTAVVVNANACSALLAKPNPDLAEVSKAVSDIAEAGTRAGAVISSLRALIRKGTLDKTELKIAEVIHEALSFARTELRRREVSTVEEAGSQLMVIGDRVQLQQVLLNLILNGVEAITADGKEPRILWITARTHSNDEVIVTIRDSGIGLDEANISRLFDPFYTTKPDGLGMGLKISRSIIKAHGGRLWATANSDGPGATFQFTLPSVT